MKHRAFPAFVGMAIACLAAATSAGEAISIQSLLEEMTRRDELARWPAPAYTTRTYSSYDRESTAPDKPGWFANIDFGQYIREDNSAGRKEWVMMEADGPGAIVRWWAGGTTPQMGPPGTIRIYLDGKSEPAFAGRFDELVTSGRWGEAPFAAIRCIGRNYYVPIPYANGCRITYDHPPYPQTKKTEDRHWYVIEARAYPKGTAVRSFSADEVRNAAATMKRVARDLEAPGNVALPGAQWLPPRHAALRKGESLAESIEGSKAIRRLSVQVKAADLPQALRSTVLAITCDGERTVWCPVGDFFGSGIGLNPYRDAWREVDRNGVLTCYWVMPFVKSCRIELLNLGEQAVEATLGQIAVGDWAWDERSMHFCSAWRQEHGIATKAADGTKDFGYVQVEGQGVYVGDTLAMHNGSGGWWGEGDEKIFVDGSAFPSHIGTGTEDYYGYSYGDNGTFFESPFHAEPRWDGNRRVGFVTNTRTRMLDAIPFTRSLKVDMEVWHWQATKVSYAAATYWYARPGAKTLTKPDEREATRPIDELRGRLPGVLEGEELRIRSKTGGVTEFQHDAQWSGGTHLWWRDGKPGDRLELVVPVTKAGRYRIVMQTTFAFDYGVFKFRMNGKDLGGTVDLYSAQNALRETVLGEATLEPGEHVLTAEIAGSNPAAKPRHMLGLDYVRLQAVE